jgi:hypothetical protein
MRVLNFLMRYGRMLLLTLMGFGIPAWLSAQTFPENSEEFLRDITLRLQRDKSPQNDEMARRLSSEWLNGNLTTADQIQAIRQINKLIVRGFSLNPHIVQYLRTLLAIRYTGYGVNIPTMQFFSVTDSCSRMLSQSQTYEYLMWLERFCPEQIVFQTAVFKWKLMQSSPPTLVFTDSTDDVGGRFPALKYIRGNIIFFTKGDSGSIKEVEGYYNLLTRRFHGKKGKYDWGRVGMKPTEAWCTFKKFDLDLTIISFAIDSVTLNYPSFLPRPLIGSLQEHLEPVGKPEDAHYPLFRSYEGGMRINNFVDRVNYEGGFSLRGVTKIGSKTPDHPATLLMYNKKDELVIRVETDEVALNPKRMFTDNANVTFYYSEKDSINHGSMKMLYIVDTKDISFSLNRKDRRSRQALRNTYHKMEMYFDEMKWNTNKDTMIFSAIVDREHKLFAVESFDYYSDTRYRQLKGVLDYNPVGVIYEYYKKVNNPATAPKPKKKKVEPEDDWDDWGTPDTTPKKPDPKPEEQAPPPKRDERRFFINDLIRAMKIEKTREQFLATLEDLEGSGYLTFTKDYKYLTIREPLISLGKALQAEKDYDAISITSIVEEGNNAQMSVTSKRIDLFGVDKFSFSDSQFVEVEPQNQQVQLYKDRELKFGGKIKAGKINLTAHGLERYDFIYDDFKIYCDSIATLTFSPERDPNFARQKDNKLTKGLQKLRIQDLAGMLYIDRPRSKSGIRSKPFYSVFDCHTPSFVYWSDSSIQKGVYSKDKFFFVVDPFIIDSLETFNLKNLEFTGELNTSEITPAFRDTLKPVSDNTYGIHEILPDSGISMYNNKGRFFKEIQLDGRAFHGKGKLKYRKTEAESDDFVFHFDSVMAITKNFFVEAGTDEGVSYPEIFVGVAKYKWYTKRDELEIQTINDPILLYGGKSQIWGKLIISPKGIRASGALTLEQESFDSDSIFIDEKFITMQNGTYRISDTTERAKVHFVGRNMSAKRDVESGNTEFYSLKPSEPNITFPLQKYRTSLGVGSYNREAKQIVIQAMETQTQTNYLVSTDSSQHGLRFPAKILTYAIGEDDLYVQGVDSINVADATIKPGGGQQIKIMRTGKVEDLEGAEIIASRKNRYHKFYDCKVQIKNGIYYTAAGKYKYVPINGQDQVIDFYDISVRKDTVTVAQTFIEEDQNFFVTERFFFKDSVELSADRKFMTFKGKVKIQSSNPALGQSWVKTTLRDANPDSVVVQFDKSGLGQNVIGLFQRADRAGFYARFLQRRDFPRDIPVLQAEGAITFDRTTKEFRIGSLEKLKNQRYVGNVVSFLESGDTATEVITTEGKYDFPVHYQVEDDHQRGFHAAFAGRWKRNNTKNTSETNLMLKLDLPEALAPALDFYVKFLEQSVFEEGDANVKDPLLLKSFAEFADANDTSEAKTKALADLIAGNPAVSRINFGQIVPKGLLLGNLRLRYCDSTMHGGSGFFYNDKPVYLMGLRGKSFNKAVTARIVYKVGLRTPIGSYMPDHLYILLQISEGNWIYFECTNNQVKTTASNPTYQEQVRLVANKIQKKNKGDKNKLDIVLLSEGDLMNIEGLHGPLLMSGCGK